MKHYVILLIILFFFIECKKENANNEQQPNNENKEQTNIIVGDKSSQNLFLSNNSPGKVWISDGLTSLFYLDVNDNSTDDFAFSVTKEFVQGGTILRSSVFIIKSLIQNAEISTDSTMNPIVYNLGDTLKLDSNWNNGELKLLNKKIVGGPFDEISYSISGNWYDVHDSYIGIKLDSTHLGWIKITVNSSINIYEWALTK